MNAILDEIQRVIPLVWEASERDDQSEGEEAYELFRKVRYLFLDATRALNAMPPNERAEYERRFMSYHPDYQEMVELFDLEHREINENETY